MNVSVDWEPGGGDRQPRRSSRNRPGRAPRVPAQGTGGQPGGPQRPGSGRGRRTRLQLAAVMGLGLVAVVVAVVAAPSTKSNGHGGSGTSPAPTQSGGPSASSDAAALPHGTATGAGIDGTRRVSGLPRGFAHTTDGAVEAASSLAGAYFQVNRMTVGDRTAYLRDAMVTEPAGTEAGVTSWQQNYGLNADGQYLDPTTGQVSTTEKFVALCHPQLGAYRVVNSAPNAVTVDVWQSCVLGLEPVTGNDLSGLKPVWMVGEWGMVWKGGDWKVATSSKGNFTSTPTPPAENGGLVTVAPSYAERAQILSSYGSGWTLYADATEQQPAELGSGQ